jgi:hypothetical protein
VRARVVEGAEVGAEVGGAVGADVGADAGAGCAGALPPLLQSSAVSTDTPARRIIG